jgi:DNA-binding transcriptional regulator PaaX
VDEELAAKLDRITFLLNLAFREQIDAARKEVLADPVSAAVVEAMGDDWVAAGDLKRQVAATTGQSERTVSRRVSQLVAQGWVASSGSGANIRYRASGV